MRYIGHVSLQEMSFQRFLHNTKVEFHALVSVK